jgi:hypothetical protein
LESGKEGDEIVIEGNTSGRNSNRKGNNKVHHGRAAGFGLPAANQEG